MKRSSNLEELMAIFKAFGCSSLDTNAIPKLWNMDTSLVTIINSFHKKLKFCSVDLFECNKVEIKHTYFRNDKKDRVIFLLQNQNITPSKNAKEVAINTATQYLKLLNYLNLIILNSSNDKNITSIIKNDESFFLSIDVINFLNYKNGEEWLTLERLIDFIVSGINKKIDGYKDIAFSFLVIAMWKFNRKLIEEEIGQDFFLAKKSKSKKKTENYFAKLYDNTYRDIVDLLEKRIIEQIELNQLYDSPIDYLFELIYSRINDQEIKNKLEIFIKDQTERVKFLEQENLIKCYRSQLRENILKTRKPKNDKYYSDIVPIDSNVVFYHDSYEQQEAAHIFDVWRIKETLEINDESLNYMSDPNNGILIDHIYHDALDNGWISFNTKGEMVAKDKWLEYYGDDIMSQKYPLMKIREEVFNKNMKNYLINRNKIPGTKHNN